MSYATYGLAHLKHNEILVKLAPQRALGKARTARVENHAGQADAEKVLNCVNRTVTSRNGETLGCLSASQEIAWQLTVPKGDQRP